MNFITLETSFFNQKTEEVLVSHFILVERL